MTHLLKIIHRPFCEQFHVGTFFHITEEARTDSEERCPHSLLSHAHSAHVRREGRNLKTKCLKHQSER